MYYIVQNFDEVKLRRIISFKVLVRITLANLNVNIYL